MDNKGQASLGMDAVSRADAEWLAPGQELLTVIHETGREAMRSTSSMGRAAGPGTTVLLVDDDDDLRQVMEWTLEMEGYAVVSCKDPQLASEAFRSRADIDLLLTDLQMPGRSGVQLASELTAVRPSLPVMIVSGSVVSAEFTRKMWLRHWKFLSKPFDIPVLLDSIHQLLRLRNQKAA